MNTEPNTGMSLDFDGRITLYRTVRVLVITLIAGLLLKGGCIDSVRIQTDQMQPSLMSGDQIIFGKTAFAPPGKWIMNPSYDVPVVFRHPDEKDALGCLRIAAFPGDTVSISDGVFSRSGEAQRTYQRPKDQCPSLPAEYSPRDWMKPYRLPSKGETVQLDSLPIRDLAFALSIMKQENPGTAYEVIPTLQIDSTDSSDLIIEDFALFKGPLHAVPQEFATDWFFWDRLRAYIRTRMPERQVSLHLHVTDEGTPVSEYTVKGECYFMLADNWCKGVDSRHFGPVSSRRLLGRARMVLWSRAPEKPRRFRSERVGKIVN